MAVYKADILDVELNTGNIARSFLCHNIGKDDTKADRFGVRVYRDGEPESLSGCSIQGYMMRPNGTNLAITGSNTGVSGNEAWVDLPQAAYDYEGQFCLALKLIGGGVTGTIRIIDGMINNTFVDDALVPMQSVPTYQEILAVYDQMVAAKNGSVRFDQSQSLTETQKSVARMNIDAASDSDVSDLKSAITNIVTETYGKNLWNPDALNTGKYYNGVLDNDTNFRSIIIDVNPGDIVTCSYKAPSGNQAIANIYSVGIYNGDTITSTPSVSASTYTVPENISKIGVSVRTGTYGLNIQIEITENGQYTPYEPYTVTYELNHDVVVPEVADARGDYTTLGDRLNDIDAEIDDLQPEADTVVVFNLFDYSKWTDGFIKPNGTTTTQSPATASSTYATSDPLPAKTGDVFVCSARGATERNSQLAPIGYFAEYSENGSLLTYSSSNQNAAKVTNANTAYIRMTIRIGTYGSTLKVEKNAYGLYTSYTSNATYKNLQQPSFVFVPKYIYCAVGRTIEIYNSQILLDNDDYIVRWICDVGAAMGRKFTVTATSAMLSGRTDSQLSIGQYRLFINIYNKSNQLVWQGCSILWIKAALASAKSVIPIGDSLTNWKKWLPECIRLSGNNLTFVGTRYSGADQDSAGNEYASGTIHHEGRSGWSAASYLANTEYTFDDRYDGVSSVLGSANPFWNGNAFSLNHYLTTQGKSAPDAVQIWLGTNDIAEGIEPSVTNILAMVNGIRAEYPSLKIIICNTIYRSNQDGYASVGSDGYAGASGALAYAYNEDIKVMQLAKQLTLALLDMQDVFVSPLYCSHDTEYNFGWTEYHPNPRAEQIVHIPAESVHPATQGYWQLADILFSAYSVLL